MVRLGRDAVRPAPLPVRERARHFEHGFPADFICEAQDQTRGWFYSLLAVSTLLGGPAPYRNVVCLGLILDEEGQKMSKSSGNTVEPWEVLDTLRRRRLPLVLLHLQAAVGRLPLLGETIGEGVRLFLKQLWSTYYFYVLYAQRRRRAAGCAGAGAPRGAGRRARSRPLGAVAHRRRRPSSCAERLDAYDATTAGTGDRGARRRALQLVRAPLAPALLGRRAGRVRDAAHVPARRSQAARAVLPVHRR